METSLRSRPEIIDTYIDYTVTIRMIRRVEKETEWNTTFGRKNYDAKEEVATETTEDLSRAQRKSGSLERQAGDLIVNRYPVRTAGGIACSQQVAGAVLLCPTSLWLAPEPEPELAPELVPVPVPAPAPELVPVPAPVPAPSLPDPADYT